jgi:23S rRNA (cytidine1920-2'-O)/16S rRNA (cytidine1409-2'-O)-methyltransferase
MGQIDRRIMARARLDQRLVAQGLLPDIKTAQAWVLAGDVLVDGAVCAKPGTAVGEAAVVALRRAPEKYASRGGLKLAAALERFALALDGQTVLDAGASTGGFTDCLLQHGAARVYAVDVGYGQLRGKLRCDPRVVNLERTNVGDLELATFEPALDLAVFDLSYLSAVKAVPIVAALFRKPVSIIGLVKPLFEGVPPEGKRDPALLAGALDRVLASLPAQNLAARGLIPSPIAGSNGTAEFLLWITGEPATVPPGELRDRALRELPAEPE